MVCIEFFVCSCREQSAIRHAQRATNLAAENLELKAKTEELQKQVDELSRGAEALRSASLQQAQEVSFQRIPIDLDFTRAYAHLSSWQYTECKDS